MNDIDIPKGYTPGPWMLPLPPPPVTQESDDGQG